MRAGFRATFAAVCAAGSVAALAANRFAALAESQHTLERGLSFARRAFLDFAAEPSALTASPAGVAASVLAAALVSYLVAELLAGGVFRHGEEHGSARLASRSEIARFADRANPVDNVILSRDASLRYSRPPGRLRKYERNRNCLVIGGSGSGKTRGYIVPNLVQIPAPETAGKDDPEAFARSFVVTDPKGMTRRDVGFAHARNGYVVKEINVVDWASSDRFNPFEYIRSEEDVSSFVTCLTLNTELSEKDAPKDPFWPAAERMFLQALINYMITCLPAAERTFPSLCALLDMAEVKPDGSMSPLDVLMFELEHGVDYTGAGPAASDAGSTKLAGSAAACGWEPSRTRPPQPDHPAVRDYNSWRSGAEATKQSVLITCKVRLARVRAPRVEEMLSGDDLELEKIGERKTVLYLVPHDQDKTYNFIFAILIWQLLKILSDRAATRHAERGGRLPVGVDLLLDEAANFYIPDLEKVVSQCRSRNIGLTLVVQSYSQLESRYGEDANTIMDNCDSVVFLGGKSNKTNEELEKMMGTQTVTTRNASQTKGLRGSMSRTLAQHGRSLMQSSEIATMDRDECLVLISNEHPFKGRKYDVEKHPMRGYLYPGTPACDFPRGFDYAAWRENEEYWRAEASLSSSASLSVAQADRIGPSGALERVWRATWEVVVANAGPGSAIGVVGDISARVPDAGPTGVAWELGRAWRVTRDGADRMPYNVYSKSFEAARADVEAGGRVRYVIEMDAPAGMLSAAAKPGERILLGTGVEWSLGCATAEGQYSDEIAKVALDEAGFASAAESAEMRGGGPRREAIP